MVRVRHAAKVKALPVHRAMAHPPRAAMDPKVHRAWMARAMVAVKAVAPKNNVAIRVLTTGVMAKAVPHHAVPVLRGVVQVVVLRAAMAVADTGGVKTTAATMATSCHATSTP